MNSLQTPPFDFAGATRLAADTVGRALAVAELIRADKLSDIRREACECPRCFYLEAVQQERATYMVACHACGDIHPHNQTGGAPKLCFQCARGHKLCRRCGADLQLKVKRRKWPAVQP